MPSAVALPTNTGTERLVSLDALRGFYMLFIMGGVGVVIALANYWPCKIMTSLAVQMHHVSWHGFAYIDMIFPSFLFLAGVAFPFSLAKQLAAGKLPRQIYRKMFIRALLLVLLGIIYGNAISFDFANLRYASVLGHIGLAWFIAGLIAMNTRTGMQIVWSVIILIGYWLLLALIPAPDAVPPESFSQAAFTERVSQLLTPASELQGNFSMEKCLVGYVDRNVLPGKLYLKIHDPEGILSLIPAIVTALLGMMTGNFLRRDPLCISPGKKTLVLIFVGGILIIVGHYWNLVFPINKNLWTSSFVCFVGGLSMISLAVFYYVIDVLKCRWWAFPFAVIGMNSITIYLAQQVIGFQQANEFFFEGIAKICPTNVQPLIMAAGYIIVCWGFLYFFYRQKIFMKV